MFMTMPGRVLPDQPGVQRCPVQLGDEVVDAFVKHVPLYQVVREVLCALIAEEVGLPVLRPGLVRVDGPRPPDQSNFAFATLALSTSPLRGMLDDAEMRRQLGRWPHLALAIAFDEWIGNGDRTPANLLYRGADEFILIDHGEAVPANMAPHRASTANLLARLAFADVSRDEEHLALRRVNLAAARFHELDMMSIQVASQAEHWDAAGMLAEVCRWLTDRLDHLNDLLAKRLGIRQQSLPMQPRNGATP